jgi:hypothetical protein
MLKKAARRADAVARQLPDIDAGKARTRADIARLGNECGCALGGVFLVAATLLVAAYTVFFDAFGARLVVLGVVFVFAASLVGKLVGVLIAVTRLTVIRQRLAARVAGVADAEAQTATSGT